MHIILLPTAAFPKRFYAAGDLVAQINILALAAYSAWMTSKTEIWA